MAKQRMYPYTGGFRDGEYLSAAELCEVEENEHWAAIGDLLCGFLGRFYGRHRERFQQRASKRGMNIHQYAAAAIVEAVREQVTIEVFNDNEEEQTTAWSQGAGHDDLNAILVTVGGLFRCRVGPTMAISAQTDFHKQESLPRFTCEEVAGRAVTCCYDKDGRLTSVTDG